MEIKVISYTIRNPSLHLNKHKRKPEGIIKSGQHRPHKTQCVDKQNKNTTQKTKNKQRQHTNSWGRGKPMCAERVIASNKTPAMLLYISRVVSELSINMVNVHHIKCNKICNKTTKSSNMEESINIIE